MFSFSTVIVRTSRFENCLSTFPKMVKCFLKYVKKIYSLKSKYWNILSLIVHLFGGFGWRRVQELRFEKNIARHGERSPERAEGHLEQLIARRWSPHPDCITQHTRYCAMLFPRIMQFRMSTNKKTGKSWTPFTSAGIVPTETQCRQNVRAFVEIVTAQSHNVKHTSTSQTLWGVY